mmetsp:Transcript_4660/g.7914  ORF Transcript_4660/g.7914 Transcript_4660/m.7914 type:complete len:250 (+) Transcript_4660:1040-1789(+)
MVINRSPIDQLHLYNFKMLNSYIDQSASISTQSSISSKSVVGMQTQVGHNSSIVESILGPHCSIGENVRIVNSIIERNVVIEDGCLIENAYIQSGSSLGKGVTLNKGVMVAQGLRVKEGVSIVEGSICSMIRYDIDEQAFLPVDKNKKEQNNFDYFECGQITYIPREFALARHEWLGGESPYANEVESDLDLEEDEVDLDPVEEFKKVSEEIFLNSLQAQSLMKRPHNEFVKTLIKEIRSQKMIYNVQN